MWKGWSPSRKLAAVVLLVVIVAAGAAIASNDDGGSASARTTDSSSTTAKGTTGGQAGSTGGSETTGGGTTATGGSAGAEDEVPSTTLPLEAKVKDTKGLHDGDEVTITVKADKGSLIYGVEMRMCRAGTVINHDADMLPSVTGQCASQPLSPGADGYKIVPAEPPYQEVTATYKVGIGSDTYQLDDASQNTVTCDATHPCVLAVKYQIPNGFGFRTYPLTFS